MFLVWTEKAYRFSAALKALGTFVGFMVLIGLRAQSETANT